MATFDPLKTMSFTKWFAVTDYLYSLGFPGSKMPEYLLSTVRSPPLNDKDNIGLVGIITNDNGKTVSNAMGWDMNVKLIYYNQSMRQLIVDSGYAPIKKNSPTLPRVPGINMGSMTHHYSEINDDQQSSIMFAYGEWFDGVQGQLSTPSVFSTIDRTDNSANAGKLSKPLKLITPFENAFDHLGLSQKALKQITNDKTGLLASTRNSNLSRRNAGAELWCWNTPYVFIRNLVMGAGIAQGVSDRKNMLLYFYFRSKWEQEINDPDNSKKYSGKRPFRYFGYPLTSILYAIKNPDSSLATINKEVEVKVPSVDYKYGNSGSPSLWQQINDPSAVLSFTDKARPVLWVIRSLSQYGNASKAGGRMHPPKPNPEFPSTIATTNPDYTNIGFWTAGQGSPTQFNNIIESVINDPSPTMATILGAVPAQSTATKQKSVVAKPIASAQLTSTTGKTPTRPKRKFSPQGVKVTINDFTDSSIFLMGNSWVVLNITPDQGLYNKIMKDWENGMIGSMKKKVTPPTNIIKQYPKVIQLAFKAGSTLLINTNGKSKPEWKEYKWDRDKDAVTVGKDSRFSFIDNDTSKGIQFALYTSIGTIVINQIPDNLNGGMTTKVDEWFKEGATEVKVEVGKGKGSFILPINIMTDIRGDAPDIAIHSIIDTNMAADWYQRSLVTYPPNELIMDSYPDAWTVFGTEVEVDYFNADSLAKKLPLMFQAIPFDASTAKEIDMTKEYIDLELFVVSNTDTYTGFDYTTGEFNSEKLVFPCDERYLTLRSITNDPVTGELITKELSPAKAGSGKSISSIWMSRDGDQAKIEFVSGETIIMPDEVNRGFSAIEMNNQQELTGLITQIAVEKYAGTGFSAAELPEQMRVDRTMKNIPVNIMKLMSYEDSTGELIECGTGGAIFEDNKGNLNVILPNPDPNLGLVKFKLLWKERE